MNQHQHDARIRWAVFSVIGVADLVLLTRVIVDSEHTAALLVGVAMLSAMLIVVVRIFDLGMLSVGKEGMKAELSRVKDKVGTIES